MRAGCHEDGVLGEVGALSWWTKRAFRSFSAMVQSPGQVGARTRVTAETSGRSSRLPLSGAANGRLETCAGSEAKPCSRALLRLHGVLVRTTFSVRGRA